MGKYYFDEEMKMIEFKSAWDIVAFDGRVIERFKTSGYSEHYHIDFVESFELHADRKGRQYLRLKMKTSSGFKPDPFTQLSQEEIPQAKVLVEEVQRANTSR